MPAQAITADVSPICRWRIQLANGSLPDLLTRLSITDTEAEMILIRKRTVPFYPPMISSVTPLKTIDGKQQWAVNTPEAAPRERQTVQYVLCCNATSQDGWNCNCNCPTVPHGQIIRSSFTLHGKRPDPLLEGLPHDLNQTGKLSI